MLSQYSNSSHTEALTVALGLSGSPIARLTSAPGHERIVLAQIMYHHGGCTLPLPVFAVSAGWWRACARLASKLGSYSAPKQTSGIVPFYGSNWQWHKQARCLAWQLVAHTNRLKDVFTESEYRYTVQKILLAVASPSEVLYYG